MSPLVLAISLVAIGLVLLIAELLLPTHGLLGVLALGFFIGAVVVFFVVDVWLGTAVAAVAVLSAPFIGAWLVRIWPRTPIGRRLLLAPESSSIEPPPVQPGAIGVAITEMRPIGECEFDGQRMEAQSDHGIIHAGARVKVVNVISRRPMVRVL